MGWSPPFRAHRGWLRVSETRQRVSRASPRFGGGTKVPRNLEPLPFGESTLPIEIEILGTVRNVNQTDPELILVGYPGIRISK